MPHVGAAMTALPIVAPVTTIEGKDGYRYTMRPIRLSDAASLIRGYAALSPQARWFRMLHAVPKLTPSFAKNFCRPDPETEVCLVIEGRGDLAGQILGGARIAGIGPGEDAEFSVSMRPEAEGLGLAKISLSAVIDIARERGCRSVWGLVARGNVGMIGLAERLGFSVTTYEDDRTLLIARLPLAQS